MRGILVATDPRHPKSSKYLVSRCLEPLKAFSGDVWGFKHLLTRYIFGRLGREILYLNLIVVVFFWGGTVRACLHFWKQTFPQCSLWFFLQILERKRLSLSQKIKLGDRIATRNLDGQIKATKPLQNPLN